jgi:hypothetical protein
MQLRQFRTTRVIRGQIKRNEARHRDIWLVTVLLEKQPLQGQRTQPRIARQERGAFGEVTENRIGLGQSTAIVQLQ